MPGMTAAPMVGHPTSTPTSSGYRAQMDSPLNLSQPPVGTVNLAFVSVLLDTKYLVSGRHGTILADEVSRCDLAVT